MLAFQPLVFLLLGVDTNGNIAEDGFRTGCSYDRILTRFFRYFVAQVVELVMLVMIDHLFIGEGSLPLRIPVDHTQTTVDETFVIQVAEHFDHGFGTGLVHRKRGTVPVAGTTEFTKLF